jgi:hypothetical protein
LAKAGKYRCLSYVWGDFKKKRSIIFEDQVYSVTYNLHDALCQLQVDENTDPVWIDALCMNQLDDEEKNQQVPLMGPIYKQAFEVIVWLGPPPVMDSNSRPEAATEEYIRLSEPLLPDNQGQALQGGSRNDDNELEAVEFLRQLDEDRHFHELSYFGKCGADGCWSTQLVAERSWKAALESLTSVLDVPWFQRTWTIQELVLARKVIAWYGKHRIEWSLISGAWQRWSHHVSNCCGECIGTLPDREYQVLHRIAASVNDLINAEAALVSERCLLHPLLRFKFRAATNDRDKIFGLLGLQQGKYVIPVRPEYTTTLREVYTEFAIQLTLTERWLVPLHLDLTHNKLKEDEGSRSWVPDWTYCNSDPPGYAVARYVAIETYHCDKWLKSNIKFLANDIIQVSGVELDRIEKISAPFRIQNTVAESLAFIIYWRQFLNMDVDRDRPYVLGGTILDCFRRTMFADRFHHDKDLPRPLQDEEISAWEQHLGELQRRLAERGPRATFALHPTMASHVTACLRRRLFVSSKGYVGLCPDSAQAEDSIFVLCACPAPIFLRQVPSQAGTSIRIFKALGHGYVHGLMNGEAEALDLPIELVHIV